MRDLSHLAAAAASGTATGNLPLHPLVADLRQHHASLSARARPYPNRIFHTSFLHDAGTLSWIALILTGPVVLGAILLGSGPAAR